MHTIQRTTRKRRALPPAIEAALAQCVARAGMSSAFIAVERQIHGKNALVIWARAVRPNDDEAPNVRPDNRLTAGMREALQTALQSGCPVLTTSKRGVRGHPRVLVAAPVMAGARARAVLGAVGFVPAPYANAVRVIQRAASGLDTTAFLSPKGAPAAPMFIREASARQDVLLHELRVPLSAANLLLERLNRLNAWDTLTEDASDMMRAAQAAVREAQSIVRTLSQLQALKQDAIPIAPQPVQVQKIIERAVALLPGSVERLRRAPAEALPDVLADPLWLTHVLTNLLENAMTHTPAPQVADMSAALSADKSSVIVSVTSYGAGIPLAEQQRLLLPYHRRSTADDLTSKGLGLSIAKYLVTAMSGELWLESDGRHSATFRVSLPVAACSRHL